MEWWVLSSLAVVAFAVGALTRIRRSRRSRPQVPGQNIYPLW
jgi:hypothetical protein